MAIKTDEQTYWLDQNHIENLHLTAYGLMILNVSKQYNDAKRVFNYLTSRQAMTISFGTRYLQDSYNTMICTEAMTDFIMTMKQYNPEDQFVDLKIDSGNNYLQHLSLTPIEHVY